jgi:translation initiation factor IF-3
MQSSLLIKNYVVSSRFAPTILSRSKATHINFKKNRERKNEMLKRREEALSRYNENIMKEKNVFRVNLVGEKNELLGEMSTMDAIEMAKKLSLQKHRLCVVLVDQKRDPPICKLTLEKEHLSAKEKHKGGVQERVKVISITPNTSEHDLQIKIRVARRLLERKYRIKVVVKYEKKRDIDKVLTVAILENIKLRCWELIDEKAKVTDDAKEGLFLFLSPNLKELEKREKAGVTELSDKQVNLNAMEAKYLAHLELTTKKQKGQPKIQAAQEVEDADNNVDDEDAYSEYEESNEEEEKPIAPVKKTRPSNHPQKQQQKLAQEEYDEEVDYDDDEDNDEYDDEYDAHPIQKSKSRPLQKQQPPPKQQQQKTPPPQKQQPPLKQQQKKQQIADVDEYDDEYEGEFDDDEYEEEEYDEKPIQKSKKPQPPQKQQKTPPPQKQPPPKKPVPPPKKKITKVEEDYGEFLDDDDEDDEYDEYSDADDIKPILKKLPPPTPIKQNPAKQQNVPKQQNTPKQQPNVPKLTQPKVAPKKLKVEEDYGSFMQDEEDDDYDFDESDEPIKKPPPKQQPPKQQQKQNQTGQKKGNRE